MALSDTFVAAHIAHWEQALTISDYPYRRHWPSCLFHHAPFENAVSILSTGMLRSRNDPANPRPRDVAAQGVNQARIHAHDRVRLYFRPKTPTQYHIEGIRKPGECKFGEAAHAPVLVMLVLDARWILTLPDIQFCDRNMQRGTAVPGDSEQYFAAIPFEHVFHEGPTGGDEMISAHRCAEVLTSSPLPLDHCIRAIYFRSEPERDTVLHALGLHRKRWLQRCFVSDALKVFEKKYSFVQEINLQPDGVVFTLNPRWDRQTVEIRITVLDANGVVAQFYNSSLAAAPAQGQWIYHHEFPNGEYLVRVEVDGHLAYQAPISLLNILF